MHKNVNCLHLETSEITLCLGELQKQSKDHHNQPPEISASSNTSQSYITLISTNLRPAEVWKSGIHSNATNMLLAEAFFSKAELSRAEQHNAFDQNSPFSAFLDSTKIDF